jgi:hypothetical protein
VTGHVHQWRFVDAPGRWTATCACGLAVTVEAAEPGRGIWTWRLGGGPPSAEALLESVTSVVKARRAHEQAGPKAGV